MQVTTLNTVETRRLRLRAPVHSDAAAIFEYARDPEVTRYMEWQTHTGVDRAVEFLSGALERLAAGTELTWMVTVKPGDRAIGAISCRMRGHAVDFGYVLHRQYWGQGLATEAARAIVDWVSGLEHVDRVWAMCDVANIASARVLEKSGLTREGILRSWAIKPNIGPQPRDVFVYSKVRSAGPAPVIREVYPYLHVRGGAAAIDFYKRAFGAEELCRLADPGGRVAHAEVKLGPVTLMLADEYPDLGVQSPLAFGGTGTTIHLHVENVDDLARRAVEAGATMVMKPVDQGHGERQCRIRDPFGHEWLLGHEIETAPKRSGEV